MSPLSFLQQNVRNQQTVYEYICDDIKIKYYHNKQQQIDIICYELKMTLKTFM